MLCRRESPEARAISQEYVSVEETGHLRKTSPSAVAALREKCAESANVTDADRRCGQQHRKAQSKAAGEVILAVL